MLGSTSLSSYTQDFAAKYKSADATQSCLAAGATIDVLLNAERFTVVSSSKVWDPGGSRSSSCLTTAAIDTNADESDTTQSELCYAVIHSGVIVSYSKRDNNAKVVREGKVAVMSIGDISTALLLISLLILP